MYQKFGQKIFIRNRLMPYVQSGVNLLNNQICSCYKGKIVSEIKILELWFKASDWIDTLLICTQTWNNQNQIYWHLQICKHVSFNIIQNIV